jgi:hypothetical protein
VLLSITRTIVATPSADECASGNGCILFQNGATASFNFNAAFDIGTLSQNGQLTLTISSLAPAGLTLSSSTLLDYAVLDGSSRGFAFGLMSGSYSEARLFVMDNGSSGDTIQIQLLDLAGTPVLDTLAQPLSASCGGGITFGTCNLPSPCQLEVTVACAVLGGKPCSPASDCTIKGTSGDVSFFYTIKNVGSSSVALASLTGSDAFGGLDFSSLGSGSLAPGEEVTVKVDETVSGPFPFVNTVTVSGGSAQCSDAATITIQQKGGTPPGEDCEDFVTGGGWIIGPSGAKANFGVHGGIRNGSFWGGLNFLDHGIGLHVKSSGVTGYSVLSEVGRQINFDVTIDGVPGTAIVNVYDNGEPGRNDVFEIHLSNGYEAAGELGGPRPGGGNLQLHKSKCDQHGKSEPKKKK